MSFLCTLCLREFKQKRNVVRHIKEKCLQNKYVPSPDDYIIDGEFFELLEVLLF